MMNPNPDRKLNTWCCGVGTHNNCVSMNQTKEILEDLKKGAGEMLYCYRYLDMHLFKDFAWTSKTSCLVREAHHPYFFRKLQNASFGGQSL